MSDLDGTRQLARYRLWADELTFGAVTALPPGEAAKERPTRFKTMIGTLNHNYRTIGAPLTLSRRHDDERASPRRPQGRALAPAARPCIRPRA